MSDAPRLSVITPVYNEEENLPDLIEQLQAALADYADGWELVAVDDGSSDRSVAVLEELAAAEPRLRVVTFRRNFGQTAAMLAGFRYARGEIIVPIDADLQNDPADIPKLVAKLDEGFDVVSGWRRHRKDKKIRRVFLSRIANGIISRTTGVRLHDYGCSLKAYRAEVVQDLTLYGEMHRFIPVHASWQGAKVTELEVNHRPRTRGVSKYGMERILKVILDLIIVKFMGSYFTKPIYVFGKFALFFLFLAFAAGVWALVLKLAYDVSFILTPLPTLVTMCFLTSVLCLLMGITTEMVVRTYFEAAHRLPYKVRRLVNFDSEPDENP